MTDKTEAQQRMQTYIDRRKQSRGLDKDHIHSIDSGDSSEATLLTSDLEALLGELQQLKAQLSARQAVPDGWRLVPVEPTEEMLEAAHQGDREYTLRVFGDVMTVMQGPHDHYVAMLSAAPPPPEREPLSQHDLERLVGNWFAEGWAKKAAFGMLDDYELTRNGATNAR